MSAKPAEVEPAGGWERTSLSSLATVIETEFGGLFYLVNLGLYLGLYGDFTMPLVPGIALNPFDFVALVGRDLVGEALERDPVWALLAQLTGRRADAAPGAGFEPPADWQIPDEWLAASGEAKSTEDPPLRSAGAERAELFDRQGARMAAASAALAGWLGVVLPYIRLRLCRALGLAVHSLESQTAEVLATLLFRRRARVYVTASHVDVMLSLAELPIEVRLAGLDRDPGWLPVAGRAVAFHFE